MHLEDSLNCNHTYIIAEMSGNHGGSLENAIKIVRAAAEAGADCLKIQTYTADTITLNSRTELFKVNTGLWRGEYLYDLYQKAYTPWEWTEAIKEETEALGMEFLSTPFDFTAVDYLANLNVDIYKIASFELVDIPLIKRVAAEMKPIIISCGMGSEEEIREAVEAVFSTGNKQLVLLKCCSAYPADYSRMNLSTIADMQKKFGVDIGLSDHSAGSLASIVAVSMGAKVIEKHLCLSRDDKTVDSDFSMDKDGFKQLVKDIRNAESAMGNVYYGPSEDEVQSYAHRRSLFASKDIQAGELLTADNIKSVRPADGLHTRYYDSLVMGGRAKKDINFATPLSWDLVEV